MQYHQYSHFYLLMENLDVGDEPPVSILRD